MQQLTLQVSHDDAEIAAGTVKAHPSLFLIHATQAC
jgi:hypothetical protein